MKKIIAMMLCVILVLSSVGCGQQTEVSDSEISSNKEISADKEIEHDTGYSVTSKINGQEISADIGMTSGIYAVSYYDFNNAELVIPDPVIWSNGSLSLKGTSEGHVILSDASEGAECIYYTFKTDSSSAIDDCMSEYIDELISIGFSCRSERVLNDTWYYLEKENNPLLMIEASSTTEMKIALPLCYGFEVEDEGIESPFLMASSFLASDYDCEKDRFEISGFDGTDNGGYFRVYLSPELYKEGSIFDTDAFSSQANVSISNAVCYCSFLSKVAGETGYSSLKDAIPLRSDQDSYSYFRDLEVEVLQMNSTHTVFYFYAEIDAGKGVNHRIEGLVNAFSLETTSDSLSLNAGEECPKCNGWGYVTCTACGGDGKESCSRCGGKGKTKSAITHKYETCSGCSGLGERSCGFCDNGKNECSACDGTGKVQ